MASGLADRLKAATAADHAAAEGHPFQQGMVRGRVDRWAFAAHQAGWLDLVRLVGTRLRAREGEWAGLAEAMDAHAARLEADLATLGEGSPGERSAAVSDLDARCGGEDWPPEFALGAFYVIEGSMNGNRFIARAIVRARPDLAGALRYFDPYGERQREIWGEFRAVVDRIGATLGNPEPVVAAARATFATARGIATEATMAAGVAPAAVA